MTRTCATPGCTRPRTPYDRRCRPCATAAQAAYRARHRFELAAREQLRVFSDEQRAIRNARAYVAVYVRRGLLQRGPCELCGNTQVSPDWDDPRLPRAVRWFCPAHRREHVETRREVAAGQAAVVEQFATLRAAIAALPAAVRSALDAQARTGLDGTGAEPGSLRYWLALRRAYDNHAAPQRQHGFWT